MSSVRLLWRHRLPAEPRRGRPARTAIDDVVGAAVRTADRVGLGFGMREVAQEVGVPVMTLYSAIGSREQLVELMVDSCRAQLVLTPLDGDWRDRLRTVAADNLSLLSEHPWLADVESERAVLGPGTLAKYEHELAAVEPLTVSDVERDAALTLVIDFVRASARAARRVAVERAQESAQEWWEREGAVLATLDLAGEFPLADRIGTAAGQAQGAASSPERALEFGLEVILDGLEARQRRDAQGRSR
jgi:AcrR family transcriptional regulator